MLGVARRPSRVALAVPGSEGEGAESIAELNANGIGAIADHEYRFVHQALELPEQVLEQRLPQDRDQRLGTGGGSEDECASISRRRGERPVASRENANSKEETPQPQNILAK